MWRTGDLQFGICGVLLLLATMHTTMANEMTASTNFKLTIGSEAAIHARVQRVTDATHLMHLESQRTMLHNVVNEFLHRIAKEK